MREENKTKPIKCKPDEHKWKFIERLDRCNPVLVVFKCTECGAEEEEEDC